MIGPPNAKIGGKFLVDVAKRRRQASAHWHGECESHGLSGAVVRILAEDDYADVAWRDEVEGPET